MADITKEFNAARELAAKHGLTVVNGNSSTLDLGKGRSVTTISVNRNGKKAVTETGETRIIMVTVVGYNATATLSTLRDTQREVASLLAA